MKAAEISIVCNLHYLPGIHFELQAKVSWVNGQIKEFILRTINFRKFAVTVVIGLIALLGTSVMTDAQGNRNRDKNGRKEMKQQEKRNRQNARAAQERLRVERERQAYWNSRNARIRAQQQQQTDRYNRSGNDRSGGAGYVYGNANANTNRDGRYRVYRDGSYYNTDYRGAELLRQAVNEGYRQGFQAGRTDRNSRGRMSWENSNVYRSGSIGYQSHVTRSQYQYYFQQGFQRGYQDGSNSRYQDGYDGRYEYGSNEGGSLNILGSILGSILNIRSY